MASEDVHSVSGFCRGFDWRPTVFQEPVPSFRICSLCGVIPKTVVQLRCTHSLCESCYARCLDDESACLVDKKPMERDYAKRLSLSINQLDEFKVLCWNAPEGCKFVGSLTGLLEHFQEQCEFHVVCCPTCDKKVLRQDIVPHIKGGNHADFLVDSSASKQTISPLRNVENTCAEIRLQLRKISDDLRNFQMQLGHLSIGPDKPANGGTKNHEGESSKTIQLLYEIKNMLLRIPEESTSFPCIFRGPTSEFFRASNTLFAAIAEVSRSARCSGKVTVHWYLEHWTDLKKHARDEGLVLSESHVQLTYGYAVSQQLEVRKIDEQLLVFSFLRIHCGPYDAERDWPFCKVYVVGIIHPKESWRVINREVNLIREPEKDNATFKRPKKGTNVGYGGFLANVVNLEEAGYIEHDVLHMYLQIMQ